MGTGEPSGNIEISFRRYRMNGKDIEGWGDYRVCYRLRGTRTRVGACDASLLQPTDRKSLASRVEWEFGKSDPEQMWTAGRIARHVHLRQASMATSSSPTYQRPKPMPADVPLIQVPGESALPVDVHGVKSSEIPKAIMGLMKRMRKAGHTAYLVGGTVRDLLLKRKPKDFDIVVDTTPKKIKKLFWGSMVVGKRVPVAILRAGDEDVEISSFHSFGEQALRRNPDSLKTKTDALEHALKYSNSTFSANFIRKTLHEKFEDVDRSMSQKATYLALLRLADAQTRDFSINALLYDPHSGYLYDSVGGLQDIQSGVVRTILPPHESFRFDPARVLRALRVSARCGFALDADTARAATSFASHLTGVDSLPGGRRAMELHALMAHGSAMESIRLAQKLSLICAIAPPLSPVLCHSLGEPCSCSQVHQVSEANASSLSKRDGLLFALLEALDALAAPSQPVSSASWAVLLAISTNKATDLSDFLSGSFLSLSALVQERSIARVTAKTARTSLKVLMEMGHCRKAVSSFLRDEVGQGRVKDFVQDVVSTVKSIERGPKKLGGRF